jgi:flagellar hook protein FlgE
LSISSSMNAGVAGLAAQASHLATISDNIANASTAGYKRMTTDFAAMVLDAGPGRYTAGGVRAHDLRLVESRGSLTTTSNATDLAIAGRGMLPVTTASALAGGGERPFYMTPTGSFFPDSAGYLRSASGLVLLGVPVGPDGQPPGFPRTTADGLVPVRIQANEIVGAPTSTMRVAANLPASATEAGSPGRPQELSVTYYDNLGRGRQLLFTFSPVVPAAGDPPTNRWTVTVADSAQGGAVIGEYGMAFDDSPGSGGRLAAVTTTSGGPYDPATGTIAVTTASGPVEIDLGRPLQPGGFTQLAADFSPIAMTRDGFPAASLTGVEVDPAGFVVARYDSGDTRRLYQIPVVDVPNPNGLTALDGQTYEASQASGGFILWDAGDGPTGALQGYAREESSVDVAQELTQLIKTQRAYSSNAKVIQTVDEMLQETTNLKR